MAHRQGPGTFAHDFAAYLKTRTDSPPDFHLYGALTALSVALGNRVTIDAFAFRALRPNLWTVILAPSGYGKSAPLDLAETLLRKAGLGNRSLPTSFSQEALADAIKEVPLGGVFFVQEFSAFLGMLSRDYNAGALQWLTDLYDVPEVYDRVVKTGRIHLEQPCFSILGASSPEWFADSFKQNMLRGGFLARFLFCPSRTPGAYVGLPGPRNERIETPLADHLRMVSELRGPAKMDRIRPDFDRWDSTYRARSRMEGSPEFGGMRSRAGALVLKCAVLFHVSHEPAHLEVCPNDLALAVEFVQISLEAAERFLTDEVAHNQHDASRLRLLEMVRRSSTGELGWSAALKNSHLSSREFGDAVRTLEDTEQIRVEKRGGKLVLINPAFAFSPRTESEFARNGTNGKLVTMRTGAN